MDPKTFAFPLVGPISLAARLGHGSLTVAARDGLTEAAVTLTARDRDQLDRITVEMRGSTLTVQAPRQGGLSDLIGGWRATSLAQTGNPQQRDPASNGVSQVTVTGTQWIFNKQQNPTTYDLHIDHTRRPAEINFMYVGQKEPYGRGILKREGNTLRIIYNWGSERPTGFDNQPGGYWDLTLVRD